MVESASSFPVEAKFPATKVLDFHPEPQGFLAKWFEPTWEVFCSALPNVQSSSYWLDFDSRLREFILDYFLKKELAKTSEAFAREASVSPPNSSYKCNNPDGLLSEWFSFFSPLFSSRTFDEDAASAEMEPVIGANYANIQESVDARFKAKHDKPVEKPSTDA